MSKGELTLSKWGNSLSIRFPKALLKQYNLKEKDILSFETDGEKIILKPEREQILFDKMFEGYDRNQPYPFEIVDKGGAVGEELY